LKKIAFTIVIAASLTACATTKPATQISAKQYDEVAQAVAAKSKTPTPAEAGTFDCGQLYENYDTAMANNRPKKKKRSFLSSVVGSGLATTAAGMMGADLGVLKTVNTVEKAANIAKSAQDAQESVQMLTSMKKVTDINKSAYNLAMENGCSVEKLEKITKSYAE